MLNLKYYPLTYPQMSIWNVEKFYKDTAYGNIAGPVIFKEKVNLDLLEKAINIFVCQNDSIRLIFSEDTDKPKQYFAEYHEFKIDRLDFDYENGFENFETWVETQTRTPFKKTNSELFYFALINLSDSRGGVYIKLHHLISDAWGMTLSVRQILDNYCKLINDQPLELNPKPSYRDFISAEQEYIQSERFKAQKKFWESKFETVPEFTTFRARNNSNTTTMARRMTFILSSDITNKINRFCAETNTSPYILFLAVFSVYIYRVTSKQDLVLGTPVLNRTNYQQKNTVGMFISNVPVRTYVDPHLELQDYLRITLKEWKQVLRNQKYPYNLLLRNYRQKHKVSENLIDIFISYQNAKFNTGDIDYTAKWYFNGAIIESLVIHISDREDEGRLSLDFDYLQDLFTEEEIKQMKGHLLNLLTDAIENPSKKLSQLQLLSTNEQNQLLSAFNRTQEDYPGTKTIHQLFEEQVEETPDRTAVVFENQKLSYSQLNQRANRLARVLIHLGAKPDTVVAILLNRSIDMIVSMLAILKAGAAYLPIDPEYPRDRVQYIISNSCCEILITHSQNSQFEHEGYKALFVDELTLDDKNAANCKAKVCSDHLAYLIYTSGSTGKPKGVMIEHKSIVNTLIWRKTYYGFNHTDAVLQLPSYAFDSSVEDIFTPLISGAKLILIDQKKLLVTKHLGELIREHGVTHMLIVPSFLRRLLDGLGNQLSQLTCITVAGEAVSEGLIQDFFNTNKSVRLFNEYGPTENSVCTTVYEILPQDRRVLIGQPINNNQCYIVDKHLNLLPVGFVGELCVSSIGLARGYLNSEELTNQKFIENPFQGGTRLYRTGDLARWLPNGNIEFIGRIDDQVKVNGLRIELGEIESCISNFPGIKECAVTTNEGSNGKKKLCAYLVFDNSVSISHLKRYLSTKLPKHMIPSFFLVLKALPLTPNGKINKKVLPIPEPGTTDTANYERPHNEVEQILANLWREVLEIGRIGINDNFFELGGDSLAIVEMLTALIEYDWNITAQDFYEYPSIKELAAKIMGKTEIRKSVEKNLARNVFYLKHVAETPAPYWAHDPDNSQRKNFNGVLLTGATGFLGAHILAELLQQSDRKVYCLVRGENFESRLRQSLDYYFPGQFINLLGERIFVINGELCLPRFGLSETNYQSLAKLIDTVIHAAAHVKHFGDYDEFEWVNVKGTQEVVNFCTSFGLRMGHVSTISVAGVDMVHNKDSAFTENDFYIGQHYMDNVYVRSKIEAENLIYQSTGLGLKATVFRVGMLTGRYSDGHFQRNISENAMYNRLKSIIQLKSVPFDIIRANLDFTPVDSCANSLVKIILSDAAEGRVFHLLNHHKLSIIDLIGMLGSLGISINVLSTSEFKYFVEDVARDKVRKKLLAGLVTDFNQEKTLYYTSPIKIDSDYTQKYLKQLDFEWPDVTIDYLQKLLNHMKTVGFLVPVEL